MKMAFKDSFGIWRENTFMHKSSNACSTLKQLMGKAFREIANSYGVQNINCPLTPVKNLFFLH